MLALALDNFQLVVIDVDIQRIVRLFAGHTNTVTDLVTDLIYANLCATCLHTVTDLLTKRANC